MSESRFVYVTFIRTTPNKLWDALIKPEFTRKYWANTHQESDWRKGSSWKLMIPDGRVGDAGEILEIDPPKRLVVSWRNEFVAEMKAEGFSTLTYDIVQHNASTVKLTLTHEMPRAQSKLIGAVSEGWPELLAGLKSLLETGQALEGGDQWPEGH
jgi:uncharacterized protein YndB with AHSA1/START domain